MAFDVITPVRMGNAELTVGLATIHTTPIETRDLVKEIDISNNSTQAAVVDVHLVPAGDVANGSNRLIPGVSVPANSILSWSGIQVLDAEGTIQASASVSDVTITISGGNAV